MEGVLLSTTRLVLRELRTSDLDLLVELDSDPEVMRFISKGVPTSREETEKVYLPRMMSYQRHAPPQGFWAAHLVGSGEFIGWFHLRPDKITPEEMELGYRLKRSAWGCGLATEGSRALVVKAFAEWDYPKVSARTLKTNLASQRVMVKAGLEFEHEFHFSESVLPGWTEQEREAVKFSQTRERFRG